MKAQDAQLLLRLLELEIVDNKAKPRRLRYGRETLAPVLTKFTGDGDDVSVFWHNFYAEADQEKRSRTIIADWEKRRADDGTNTLDKQCHLHFGVHLRPPVFPSHYVTELLIRLRRAWESLTDKPLANVARFFPKLRDPIPAVGSDLDLRAIPLGSLRETETGWSIGNFAKDMRTSIGVSVWVCPACVHKIHHGAILTYPCGHDVLCHPACRLRQISNLEL